MNSLDDVRHESWLAERAAQEEKDFLIFFTKHQDVAPVEANKQLLREFISNDGSLVTLELLEESLPHLRGSLALRDKTQILRDEMNERQALIDELPGLLASWTDGGRKDRIAQLSRLPVQQLRQEIANLKDVVSLKTLSRKELKVAAREEYAAAHPQMAGRQFEPLPEKISRRVIVNMSALQLRELKKQYSDAAIDARLQGRG